jgi:hypothetical protein
LFWYSFTTQQLEMIEAIRNAILYGGDQSLARPVQKLDRPAKTVALPQ